MIKTNAQKLFNAAALTLAGLFIWLGSLSSFADTTVSVLPTVSSGTDGVCPGSYAGYAYYAKTVGQGWGWAPSTNTTTFKASDGGGRSDTKIVFVGKSNDTGCNQTSVTIPNPPTSTKYQFKIYFPSNVPTTNYPIVLTGFNP